MRLLLPALLLAAPVLSATSDVPDLKDECDRSVRWLRAQQDRKTGAYGDGIESTALVLRALAESPRQYVRRDGPYVADALDFVIRHQDEAGWIADPGTPTSVRLAQTRAAAAAMYLYVDAETTRSLGSAVAWLAKNGVSDPAPSSTTYSDDRVVAEARITQLIAKRKADGSWDGDLETTASNVLELSAYYPLFKSKQALPDGAKPLPEFTDANAEQVNAALAKGAQFLLDASMDGKWGAPDRPDAGLTAMVIGALQALPAPRPQKVQRTIDAGLDWLVTLQREDGSIHQGMLANYVTSAVVLALADSAQEEHQAAMLRASEFLISLQASEATGYSADHPFYGGIGYGGDERPDLSNLQMALEALVASGVDEDHESFQRAVQFLQRCQNRSESNDLRIEDGDTIILSGNDGGASYFPGDSKAGFVELEDGQRVPRSYGSMTYALLKGYVFVGLEKDDPRVEACWKWLQANFTLDVNPGFEHSADPTASYQGLFYYFHSMARALNTFDADTVETPDGEVHAWRPQLAGRLIAMQSKIDGSWVNENASRWWEGNPVLATSYAMLTLAETRSDK